MLTEEIRYKVINHIKENCKDKLIFLQAINGHLDHLHCLISLGREQNIAKVAQLIKGESAFWINKNSLTPTKFIWQDDYYAISVSESNVDKVVNYIRNQEIHHAKKSFTDEVRIFESLTMPKFK